MPPHAPPSQPRLLYLSRTDVVAAGGAGSELYVEAVTRALSLHARGDVAQPLKPYLRWRPDGHPADRIIAMPGYVGGEQPAAGLKWVASRHDNPSRYGLERAAALTILNDPETHHPIAVLEGGLISAMRTAAVTAVAARHLAPPGFAALACIGCGPVGRAHLATLLEQFPTVTAVHLFDARPEAAATVAAEVAGRFPAVAVHVEGSAEAAVAAGDVVVTCTVATTPYLRLEWLRRGAFLSNVSLMDPVPEVLLAADKLVVDDWDQCNREGKLLHRLVQEGRLSAGDVHAELGRIVVGDAPGREADDELIVLNPMGMAVEDIPCAQSVYHRALDAGVGTWLSLG